MQSKLPSFLGGFEVRWAGTDSSRGIYEYAEDPDQLT